MFKKKVDIETLKSVDIVVINKKQSINLKAVDLKRILREKVSKGEPCLFLKR